MASDFNLSPSDAHPETMDFLSLAWCNFAVQSLKPESQLGSLVLFDNPMKQLEPSTPISHPKSARMDDPDFMSIPPLKSNDLKSWIWMQQAMHPELNYNSSLRKKWMPWKQIIPIKSMSIKKWFKEIKMKRKEEQRLQRAEVHAAMSIAGVAAALSAIASENSKKEDSNEDRDAAIASAAAMVAAQCAKVAEAMGAKKEVLSSVIGSAMSGTSASDILTLTAAAATSLKGAATLKVRSGCSKNRSLNGGAPILHIENNNDLDFDFEKGRLILSQGAELYVETPEGKYMPRSVSVILNSEAKVVLMMRKHNLLKSKKESIILNMHAELYKGSETEDDTCYLIVLATRKGTFKLDMVDDLRRYKTWATTINHMLKISTSFAKYQLQFH
ncbi:VAN3-binding protein [Cicer arietinum]|uniref:VAN3-binding protein n=1 Tax=Cicer arietinum TaxID=3827 RepID=A0A1S2YP88_CICAR|nr:VAN3-binding protein [Cicer arietinum]